MPKRKFIDKKTATVFRLVSRSRSDPLFYEEGATPNILVPKEGGSSLGQFFGSQIQPRMEHIGEDYGEYEYEYYDSYDDGEDVEEEEKKIIRDGEGEEEEEEEEEAYMRRAPGRIYGETTDEYGFPLDGTDYQAHIKAAGPGIFIAAGGNIQMIEESPMKLDDDILPEEYRKVQLPKAVNLKYEEVDPELLAAMEAIDNDEWEGDEEDERAEENGFIPDDFIQQAIQDEGAEDFDFDAHIRNLLKQRDLRDRCLVELTEDRYADEIRLDKKGEGEGEEEDVKREDREIDRQFNVVMGQYGDDEYDEYDDEYDEYDEEEEYDENGERIHHHHPTRSMLRKEYAGPQLSMDDALFQDALDEFLEDVEREERQAHEAWDQLHESAMRNGHHHHHNHNQSSRSYAEILADNGIDVHNSNPDVVPKKNDENDEKDEKEKEKEETKEEVRERLEAELIEAEERERELEEEEEEIGELIDLQFTKPEKDDMDCESICSTYSNLLNHPKVIAMPKRIVKKITISKKTGMPIVHPIQEDEQGTEKERKEKEGENDDGYDNDEEEDEEEEEEMVEVENLGERRNKSETKEEKKLRKQQAKELKNAKRQQKKMMKEAFKEEKKLADRKKASGKVASTFKMH